MRRFVGIGVLLLAAWVDLASAGTKPNLLVIVTDDHGYGDVSTYGASDVRTPSIDRLAAEGMRFTAMRANATVCSPSRADSSGRVRGGRGHEGIRLLWTGKYGADSGPEI